MNEDGLIDPTDLSGLSDDEIAGLVCAINFELNERGFDIIQSPFDSKESNE